MAEQTLIERAARAHWDAKRYSTSRAWDDLPQSERTKAIRHMVAALEAIREPTARMCIAGANQVENGDMQLHRRKWQAMIDAALNETA